MKLIRWLLSQRFKKTTKVVESNLDKKQQRELCEQMLNEITVAQFALYHSSNGKGVFINVPDSNMDTYIERIRHALRLVQREQPLPSIDFTPSLTKVTVDSFLVSSDGFYLDAEKAVERFKAVGLRLCKAMETSDDAEYGVLEHNRRILTKLFANMREVTHALVEVSLTN